jgi:hypothetical protein
MLCQIDSWQRFFSYSIGYLLSLVVISIFLHILNFIQTKMSVFAIIF